MIEVIVPSRTDEYLEQLLTSIVAHSFVSKLLRVHVGDNGLSAAFREKWRLVDFVAVPQPFCFAKALNTCARRASSATDLLFLNDDTRILTPGFFDCLETMLAAPWSQRYGLLSLRIEGGVGNPEQQTVLTMSEILEAKKTICFVAALVRRETWRAVGELDERFIAYGFDDDDYCRRVKLAGWKCGVTGAAVVAHGAGGFPHSSTYRRDRPFEEFAKDSETNRRIFQAKWGADPWQLPDVEVAP
jgi:hypothetical protein